MRPLRSIWSICLAFLILAEVSKPAHGAESDDPRVTAKQIADYKVAHESAWLAKASGGRSHLFYLQDEWPAVIARIGKLDGRGAKWREEFFAAADKAVANPLLSYEKEAKPKDSDELWMRPTGSDMATLGLAAKLSEDPKYRTKLHELVLNVCNYPSWGKYNDDLAAGQVVSGVSIAYDWQRAIFTAEEQEFIRSVIRQRVPNLYDGLLGKKYWCNTYTWNHNHIAVAGLGLAGAAFLGEIPEAAHWLAGAVLDYQNVAKCSAADGSSNEGSGYCTYGRSLLFRFIEGARPLTETGSLYREPFLRT